MPSLVLLVSALYLKAFATWLKLHTDDDGKKIQKNSLKVIIVELIFLSKIFELHHVSLLQPFTDLNILIICAILLASHTIGALIMPIGNYLIKRLPWPSERSVLVSYATVSLLSAGLFAVVMR